MATLFNTRIADTYQGLLKTIDNGILGAGFTEISDGSGNGTSVFLNTSGDIQATGIISFGSLKDIGENITITKFVDAADGLINNDNDTTIPTSAAIIDYVATQITLEDLDFTGDGATSGSVDLDSQTFNIIGTANEITTSAINQTLTIGLPSSITISGILTATTLLGDLNGTINTATTAVTQPLGDNSTKVATTAFVDRVITAQDLDFAGTSGNGSVDLDSQTLTIQGTTNEITTVASGQTLTVGLPSSITTDLVGNVTGNVTGNLTGDVTGNLTGNTNGIHTGNVIGNVTGDVTGALTGNVTGNVVGDLTGNTTGLHTGNVVGNVTGDLSGDVTGNVTGNVVGDLTGNVTGNVVGNVTGDLTGNADTATAWANGRTITLTGEATGVTPSIDGTTNVSAALTLTNSAVIDKVLTGLQSPAGATILATDSMLIAFGKLQSQINGIAEGLQYQGSWNASTNTPTLTSSVGTQGFYYIVNVAGSTNLNGITDWEVGDWAIFSTTGVWQRLDQTGVQGTGTTGTLTKWATGSTISDSIVSESGTALTVTGSLDTTLGSNIAGDFSVNTNKFTVGSATGNVVASGQLQGNDLDIVTTSVLSGNVTMSADASVGGTLTTASPVINTGISGSAVLDDDTFATANSTTVATSESIKAYVDAQDQGSGTVGTIAKFATSTTFNNSVITQGGSGGTELFLGGETYIPSNELIVGANNQNAATERIELDGSGNHIGGGNVIISHNRNLDIGTNDANSFGIWTTNQQRFNMSSGGTATFFGNLIGTSATFSGNVTASGGYYYGQSTNSFVRLDNTIGSQIGYNNYAYSLYDSNGVSFYTAVNATPTLKLNISTGGDVILNQALSVIKGGGSSTGRFQIANHDTTSYMMITGNTYSPTPNTISFVTATTNTALTISSGGQVIVGGSAWNGVSGVDGGFGIEGNSAQFLLDNPSYNHFTMYSASDSNIYNVFGTSGNYLIGTGNKDTSSWSEKMRISSGGTISNSNFSAASNPWIFENIGTNPIGPWFKFTTDANNSSNYYWVASALVSGSETIRAKMLSNGGLASYSGNNVNLASDIRLKKDIVNLPSEWDRLKQIKVVNYRYKDSDEERVLYGAIAQQVQEIYPNLVEVTVEATKTKPEYFGLREQPFQWLTTKVLQEAMTKIESQQTIIDTLTARLDVLEKKA